MLNKHLAKPTIYIHTRRPYAGIGKNRCLPFFRAVINIQRLPLVLLNSALFSAGAMRLPIRPAAAPKHIHTFILAHVVGLFRDLPVTATFPLSRSARNENVRSRTCHSNILASYKAVTDVRPRRRQHRAPRRHVGLSAVGARALASTWSRKTKCRNVAVACMWKSAPQVSWGIHRDFW